MKQTAMDWIRATANVATPRVETKPVEFIDWSERYPQETSLQIAVRQSTFCLCGRTKNIGEESCDCGKKARH